MYGLQFRFPFTDGCIQTASVVRPLVQKRVGETYMLGALRPFVPVSALTSRLRIQAYVDKIYTSWQYIKSWTSKDLKRYHNSVHDVRKEIRAMNYTSSFFPEIWINSTLASESKGALRHFYDVYSKVWATASTGYMLFFSMSLENEQGHALYLATSDMRYIDQRMLV